MSIITFFRQAAANLRRERIRAHTARQLRALPTELLGDIGIEPGRIDETAAQMAASPQEADPRKPAPDALLLKASVFANTPWPRMKSLA